VFEEVLYPRERDGLVWLHRRTPHPHPIHHHDDLEFTLVTCGTARTVVSGQRYDMTISDLLWLFPDQEHQILDMSPDFACWILIIRQRALRGLRRDPIYGILTERDPTGSWLRRLTPPSAIELSTLYNDLVGAPVLRANPGIRYALLRTWDTYCRSPETIVTTLHPGVTAACTVLAQDPQRSLAGVARSAGLSLSRLEHLFRQQLDSTLTSYRARQRIERFRQLAHAHPQRTVLSLALSAGFGSYPQFHRMFVRYVGQTPAAWMASH